MELVKTVNHLEYSVRPDYIKEKIVVRRLPMTNRVAKRIVKSHTEWEYSLGLDDMPYSSELLQEARDIITIHRRKTG